MNNRIFSENTKLTRLFFLVITLLTGLLAYGQTVPLAGDVNGDGSITIIDALQTAQYSAGIPPAVFFMDAADVNGNGSVEIMDAMLIARYCAGIIATFPGLNAIQLVHSSMERNMAPQLLSGELDSVVAGNNKFAFDCYKQLSPGEDNLFFSPISITFALAMCYAGAKDTTATEIATAMHFSLPGERLHNALNALELLLTTPPVKPDTGAGDELILHIANSSWGEKDFTFMPLFLDTLATCYGAGMNLVNFKGAPDVCRININNWVADKTEQRIKNLLPEGSITTITRLVLTNAIYFKANWFTPFTQTNTNDAPFYLPDDNTVTVPMMKQTIDTIYYEEPGQYQAVYLPYQGIKQNGMLVVLPAENQLQTVENIFSPEVYNLIFQKMRKKEVNLSLPKFSYEWALSLKATLQAMGMNDAFSGAADFSGISGMRNLFISDVFHKSFIAVDEKGTEASAATAAVFSETSMPERVTMTVNRPFFYYICNKDTGAILFYGRVMNP